MLVKYDIDHLSGFENSNKKNIIYNCYIDEVIYYEQNRVIQKNQSQQRQ